MTTRYFKAVRPDGFDFYSGRINYAEALGSGEVITHPARSKVRDDPSTYLSVSVSEADCAGFAWPCRLFRVEPVGRVMSKLSVSENKRAVSALRVVEELPAWRALGPNGEAVAALIERAGRLTMDEAARLRASWDASWYAGWDTSWDASWYAARDAARDAGWVAARYAGWDTSWDASWYAARDAAIALVVRDLITSEQFDLLYGPWKEVIGE